MGDRRHHRVRRARRCIDRVLTDPAGRGAARRARGPAARRAGRLARADPRHQARGRRRHPALRGPPDRPRAAPRPAPTRRADGVADAVAELLACFPVYRSYLPEGREHLDAGVRRGPASTAPTWRATLDALAPVLADPSAPAGAALPADQRHGDGQGRRGLRVLPLRRGSPRSTRSAATRAIFAIAVDEFHAAMAARQRDWPHAMTALVDPRHQARRGRPRPDRRARRGPGRVGRRRSTGCSRWRRCPTPASAACCGRRSSAPGRRRASGCTRYAEKAMREAGDRTTWTDARRGATRRPCTPPSTRRSTTPAVRARARRACVAARRRARLEQRARRQAARADDARRARRLPGQRAVGAEPGRPRQPAAGRLRPTRAALLAGARRRRAADRVDDAGAAKLAGHRRGADAAPRPARAVHRVRRRSPPTGAAADHVLAFDRGGAVTVVTRLPRRPRRARRLGRHRAARCPTGAGRDVLDRPRRPTAGAVRLGELLADLPVALLVREDA